MTDARIAPVEDNIVHFVDRVRESGPDWIVDRTTPAARAISSTVAFPLFNMVAGADPELVGDGETIARGFIDRGVPWMWWTTPSHTSLDLEANLADLGLVREDVPGMYRTLEGVTAPPNGWDVSETTVDDRSVADTMTLGFGFPDFVREPLTEALRTLTPDEQPHVTVRDSDGTTVGVATGLVSGATLGIYNVATLPEARREGVASVAVTAVMRAGLDRGCTHAILHTSRMGRVVYERLGFEVVCPTTHWVWMPST